MTGQEEGEPEKRKRISTVLIKSGRVATYVVDPDQGLVTNLDSNYFTNN
jgi:hypothetical protein